MFWQGPCQQKHLKTLFSLQMILEKDDKNNLIWLEMRKDKKLFKSNWWKTRL